MAVLWGSPLSPNVTTSAAIQKLGDMSRRARWPTNCLTTLLLFLVLLFFIWHDKYVSNYDFEGQFQISVYALATAEKAFLLWHVATLLSIIRGLLYYPVIVIRAYSSAFTSFLLRRQFVEIRLRVLPVYIWQLDIWWQGTRLCLQIT